MNTTNVMYTFLFPLSLSLLRYALPMFFDSVRCTSMMYAPYPQVDSTEYHLAFDCILLLFSKCSLSRGGFAHGTAGVQLVELSCCMLACRWFVLNGLLPVTLASCCVCNGGCAQCVGVRKEEEESIFVTDVQTYPVNKNFS
ncbi:hypothetical protein BJX65DRAFT_237110 [Aspergillus insuetus]